MGFSMHTFAEGSSQTTLARPLVQQEPKNSHLYLSFQCKIPSPWGYPKCGSGDLLAIQKKHHSHMWHALIFSCFWNMRVSTASLQWRWSFSSQMHSNPTPIQSPRSINQHLQDETDSPSRMTLWNPPHQTTPRKFISHWACLHSLFTT